MLIINNISYKTSYKKIHSISCYMGKIYICKRKVGQTDD